MENIVPFPKLQSARSKDGLGKAFSLFFKGEMTIKEYEAELVLARDGSYSSANTLEKRKKKVRKGGKR